MISERRRNKPSLMMPLVFMSLEIVMAWLILGIVEWNMNFLMWDKLT